MKICSNCKYVHLARCYAVESTYYSITFYCHRLRRKNNTHVITGEILYKGKILKCEIARRKEKFCGKDGDGLNRKIKKHSHRRYRGRDGNKIISRSVTATQMVLIHLI